MLTLNASLWSTEPNARYNITSDKPFKLTRYINLNKLLKIINYIQYNERNLDNCWHSRDVYYDYKCDIAGTGN